MTVTAKDLRFNISMLFDVLTKGEDVTITYRGKPRAKLTPINSNENKSKNDDMFGMLENDSGDVDILVRNMRQGRNFDI